MGCLNVLHMHFTRFDCVHAHCTLRTFTVRLGCIFRAQSTHNSFHINNEILVRRAHEFCVCFSALSIHRKTATIAFRGCSDIFRPIIILDGSHMSKLETVVDGSARSRLLTKKYQIARFLTILSLLFFLYIFVKWYASARFCCYCC